MKPFAKSFYCAAVIERQQPGADESYCEAAQDEKGRYTDSDEAVARFAAEVEAGEEAVRTFFSVYRADADDLSHVVGDFTDRDEARAVCALLNAGLYAPSLREALANLKSQIWAHFKLDVRKHYSLMIADSQAGKVLHNAEKAGI